LPEIRGIVKTIGEKLDQKLAQDTREYLSIVPIPPEEENFPDRVAELIKDMAKDKNEK
jgi:hypothetical protein